MPVEVLIEVIVSTDRPSSSGGLWFPIQYGLQPMCPLGA